MLQFVLVTSTVLSVVLLASFLSLCYAAKRRDGTIKLPLHGDDTLQAAIGGSHDPFDVTRPEDFIDGVPVEEGRFWDAMRRRKIFIASVLASALVLNAFLLGWLSVNGTGVDIIGATIQVVYALYTLVIVGNSVTQNTVEIHAVSIIHVTSLTTISSIIMFMTAIYPSSASSVRPLRLLGVADMTWDVVICLYILASLASLNTKLGPPFHCAPNQIYGSKTVQSVLNPDKENVAGVVGASPWEYLYFSYSTKVVMLGYTAGSLEIGDLPIVPFNMRSAFNYARMRAMRSFPLKTRKWAPKAGSGWNLGYQLLRLNSTVFLVQAILAITTACLFYVPPYFLQVVISYLETDPERNDRRWGFFAVISLFVTHLVLYLVVGQLWSVSTVTILVRLRIQLNTILFQKTLVRKDVSGSTGEDDFSRKAQVMTLMTTDVDRVGDFGFHFLSLIHSPIELVIGSVFAYTLLGVSSLFGLAVPILFLPLNHWAGKIVVGAQENLMKARDERISLMNEILGAIRMLKFMAWERSFEAKVMSIREKELKYQRTNYMIETIWQGIWSASPIFVTVVAFWHFAVVRGEDLTPSKAFTSIIVFNELKSALNSLPETFINILQSMVSVRRIEKYLSSAEITDIPSLAKQSEKISFHSCTLTWPEDRRLGSIPSSIASTPRQKFALIDLTLDFPVGGLSLVCGRLGSGKSLLLHSLLGEADILAGRLTCPRSPPDAIASFLSIKEDEGWIVPGLCAYVPQTAWLQNASIKDNILFNLPVDTERYRKTLEVCALVPDLKILEDGDESEIGERGVNLSGGQKARVSLARAVYSRASVLLLDDVLSAVDAHTAHHLYHECLKGDLMQSRTIVLVSHHVQLCVPGASYVVALDNGRVSFSGNASEFQSSGILGSLIQTDPVTTVGSETVDKTVTRSVDSTSAEPKEAELPPLDSPVPEKRAARKLIDEEQRAVGRVSRVVWSAYFKACGSTFYWSSFVAIFVLAALAPIFDNGWLKIWSAAVLDGTAKGPVFYITVYALVNATGLLITTARWFVLYTGSLQASVVLYKKLLEAVLFSSIRFHDTVSRGRLLNRFGKDFEGIDSKLSNEFGYSVKFALSVLCSLVTVSFVGGPMLTVVILGLVAMYYQISKIYGQPARDMRRLDSITRSPLYSIYGETIAGVTIIRSFGASSKVLKDMLQCVDMNINPYYWTWGINRWLAMRFNVLSGLLLAMTALTAVLNPNIDASLAGFSFAFMNTISFDLLFLVRQFVGLEQSMVAVERVKEYSDLKREPPEFIEPRPPAEWPALGHIKCEDLTIRYAPDLPDVLKGLSFEIRPGEKIGILGRTGSGKSTLALSFFRFVEATKGRILIDGLDIAQMGLTDLRQKLTIIPQDPTILSGTVRSVLDAFDEYEDAAIFEALRRVHLIPSAEAPKGVEIRDGPSESENANVFRNLDSFVSADGDNFSAGEKQLLCMARAILKRSKVLVMDEATASVDYATDELIGQTIRQEFAESTILTIAHRLRTVIDYDRVMLLEDGKIVEFDSPKALLSDLTSKFHSLCAATGREEFVALKRTAGL